MGHNMYIGWLIRKLQARMNARLVYAILKMNVAYYYIFSVYNNSTYYACIPFFATWKLKYKKRNEFHLNLENFLY